MSTLLRFAGRLAGIASVIALAAVTAAMVHWWRRGDWSAPPAAQVTAELTEDKHPTASLGGRADFPGSQVVAFQSKQFDPFEGQRQSFVMSPSELDAAVAEEFRLRCELARLEITFGTEDCRTLSTRSNLVGALLRQAKNEEAEAQMLALLAVKERVYGSESQETLRDSRGIALIYQYQGRYEEAAGIFREIIPLYDRVVGPDDTEASANHYCLSSCLLILGQKEAEVGNLDAAKAMWKEGLDHARRKAAIERARLLRRYGYEYELALCDRLVAQLEEFLAEGKTSGNRGPGGAER